MEQSLKNLLMDLETELLQPEVRKSVERLNELLADDFFEFGQSGNAYSKQDIMDMLPGLPEEHFTCSDFQSRDIANDTVLLTYILERKGNDALHKRSCRTSIWQKRGEQWQMIFHQGTPIEGVY